MIKLIAAVSLDGAIGHDQNLLWDLPEDLKRYKEKTTGNICIVGVTTYEYLPNEALKGRTHVVVSGYLDGRVIDVPQETQPRYNLQEKEKIEGNYDIWHRITIKDALELVEDIKKEGQEVYLIGGATLYESMIDMVDEADITWINKLYPEANKRFPIDRLFNDFEMTGDSNYIKSENGLMFKHTYYKRVNNG